MPTSQTWPQGKMEVCWICWKVCKYVSWWAVKRYLKHRGDLKPFFVILFLPGHFKNVVSRLYIHSTLARFTDTPHYRYHILLKILAFKRSLSTNAAVFYYLDNLCMQPPVSALWTHVNITSAICNLFISRLGFLQDIYIICVLQISMSWSLVVA